MTRDSTRPSTRADALTRTPPAYAPRPRDVAGVVVPVLLAVVAGLAVGVSPTWTALVVAGVGGLVLLLLRVELAALAVVVGSLFEDYLVDVAGSAPKALAAVLVASWALRRARGPLHTLPRSRVTDALWVFWLVLLAATLAHPNGRAGLDVVERYTGFVVVTLVLVEVLRGPLTPRVAALAYVAAAAVASAAGIATYLFRGETRVVGPIGDPNDLAFFLLVAVPFALVLRARARRRWPLDVALAVVLVGILGTYSRGALVGLAAMLLVALVTRQLSVRAVAGVVALMLVGAGVLALAAPDLVRTSLDQKAFVADQNVSERLDLWQAATTMTLEHPVLGLGPGSFALDHMDYRDSLPDDISASLDVAHDSWLEASSELGLLGLAAFLGVLLSGFGAAWLRWRADRDPLAGGVCVALVGTAAAATFVSEQYFLPLWLLAALGAAVHARATPATGPRTGPRTGSRTGSRTG